MGTWYVVNTAPQINGEGPTDLQMALESWLITYIRRELDSYFTQNTKVDSR